MLLTSVGLAFVLFLAIMVYAYRTRSWIWFLSESLVFGTPIAWVFLQFFIGRF
ncbi:MAG: hypothetical protein QM811_25610 [Pirellulales bacterium]